MALGTANAGGGFEAVGDGAAQGSLKNLAVGKLNQPPRVVGVSKLGEIAINSLLAYGNYTIDLLLGIGNILFDIKEVPASIDLLQI